MPVVFVAVTIAVVVVVAVVGYLIVQAGQENTSNEQWIEVEADPAPELPGEYVNLPEIYGGPYGTHGDNATARHVTTQVDYEADGNSNPPAGGPHWGNGACPNDPKEAPLYCGPAPWGIYREPWEPEVLVHNTEHGGVVIWYNTEDPQVVAALESLVRKRLEDGDLLVLTPYPDMEPDVVALTSWGRIDKFPVGDYSDERIEAYIDAHMMRFNPEGF